MGKIQMIIFYKGAGVLTLMVLIIVVQKHTHRPKRIECCIFSENPDICT